jgi:hypothetical protein
MNITPKIASADVRPAGSKFVHTVYVDGVPVATRRSERRYHFAIARWVGNREDGTRTVVVDRWSSSSARVKHGAFAIYVEDKA